jgi:hypothetical protein
LTSDSRRWIKGPSLIHPRPTTAIDPLAPTLVPLLCYTHEQLFRRQARFANNSISSSRRLLSPTLICNVFNMPFASPSPDLSSFSSPPFFPSPSRVCSPVFTAPPHHASNQPLTSPPLPTRRTQPLPIPNSSDRPRSPSFSLSPLFNHVDPHPNANPFRHLAHTDSTEILRHGKHAHSSPSQPTQSSKSDSHGHRSKGAAPVSQHQQQQQQQQQPQAQAQAYYQNEMPGQGLSAGDGKFTVPSGDDAIS